MSLSKTSFRNENCIILCVRFKYIIAVKKAPAWAKTVAMATPAIPHLKTITKSKSNPILKKVEIIRKYKGVFESPRPRSIALVPLNPKPTITPPI